jgi:hypothetical protein
VQVLAGDATKELRQVVGAVRTSVSTFLISKNLEQRAGINKHCDGLLLYPTTDHSVDFMFSTQGHKVRVATLDLTKKWTEVRHCLLSFLEPWEARAVKAIDLAVPSDFGGCTPPN